MTTTPIHHRHWSFVVCDKKYLYPLVAVLFVLGVLFSIHFNDPTQFGRVGNFIIGIGVWMSLRSTLRDGINRVKDNADSSPTIPGTNAINPNYFNKIAFSIGDAQLQVHGFVLVILGSIVSSYGDILIKFILPNQWLLPR